MRKYGQWILRGMAEREDKRRSFGLFVVGYHSGKARPYNSKKARLQRYRNQDFSHTNANRVRKTI